jgi:hypothetical protein
VNLLGQGKEERVSQCGKMRNPVRALARTGLAMIMFRDKAGQVHT